MFDEDIKVDVSDTKITGYVLKSGKWEEVINLSLTQWGWSVGMSTCLPVQIHNARQILECYKKVFNELDELHSLNIIKVSNL